MLWKCLLDVVFAMTTIVEGILRLSGHGASIDCRAVAFVIEFALIGSELCFFMLSVDLFTALRNPFVDYKANLRLFRIAIFCVSSLLAAVLVGVDPPSELFGITYFGVCWVMPSSNGLMWAFFYSYMIFIYVWSAFVLLYARRR